MLVIKIMFSLLIFPYIFFAIRRIIIGISARDVMLTIIDMILQVGMVISFILMDNTWYNSLFLLSILFSSFGVIELRKMYLIEIINKKFK